MELAGVRGDAQAQAQRTPLRSRDSASAIILLPYVAAFLEQSVGEQASIGDVIVLQVSKGQQVKRDVSIGVVGSRLIVGIPVAGSDRVGQGSDNWLRPSGLLAGRGDRRIVEPRTADRQDKLIPREADLQIDIFQRHANLSNTWEITQSIAQHSARSSLQMVKSELHLNYGAYLTPNAPPAYS